jgi:glyoxylase-like metal-dependent hydrolase (beta-lactamase superfamily II)
MSSPGPLLARRTFLVGVGHGSLAVAVMSLIGCGPATTSAGPTTGLLTPSPLPPETAPPAASASGDASEGSPPPVADGAVTWERVNLGFVAAYVLVRGGEAAVVDTGTPGSATVIEETLTRIGLGWDAVGHVILTHLHDDHAGSADAVLTAAADATGYAGAPDLPGIAAPRPLIAVADGDRVFDLRIVATPGHTAGSISVLDEIGGILVAGDALRTDGGRPALPDAVFSDDMDEALASVATLGTLDFETLLVGHGAPIETGAAALVAELAASA